MSFCQNRFRRTSINFTCIIIICLIKFKMKMPKLNLHIILDLDVNEICHILHPIASNVKFIYP